VSVITSAYGRRVHPVLVEQAAAAAALLPPEVHDYCAGGSGEEVSLAEAQQAWQALRFRPRVLRDVAQPDLSLSLLGAGLRTPVLVAPTALHGLVHPEAERATACGTSAAGSLLVLSTRSSLPLEDVAPEGPWWLQVYVMRDRGLTRAVVQRAAAAGASALVLTGDTPQVATRRRTGPPPRGREHLANLARHLLEGEAGGERVEQDPSADLRAVADLAEWSGLPVLVKGVLRADDAKACTDAGAAGLVVSNHGGRQLDRAVPTAVALPEVAEAVDVPVLVDGGLRDGRDVLAALALGARAVLVGRPVLWALAAGGADGVRRCLAALTDDVREAMVLAGAPSLRDVTRDLVAPG
jgi:4-hydroxymandelate oxidase